MNKSDQVKTLTSTTSQSTFSHFYLSLIVLFVCHQIAFAQMTGRDVMQKQKDIQNSKSEFIEQTMVLIDNKGRKETRTVRHYSKETQVDANRNLIVFLSPADIKGTALLTWQHKVRDDDQWLYFPARGKMQRIAKGGKKNYFMGTDFTYEDLQTEEIDDYAYTLLKEEVVDESLCYVIEAVPGDEEKKRKSGYGKRLLWVTKDRYTTLKVEFYDRRGKFIKTQLNRDWVNVGGSMWRAQKSLVDNRKTKHKTLLGTVKREINQGIDDQTFSERFILADKHVQ
jgi:hypothetical protein